MEQIQQILRDKTTYPSPVRAKGSYHSLTPCVSSDGTIVDMSAMTQVVLIDKTNNVFTAQAGMQIIDASKALRQQGLQFMTNIEIGNMTLGAAACCHSKDRYSPPRRTARPEDTERPLRRGRIRVVAVVDDDEPSGQPHDVATMTGRLEQRRSLGHRRERDIERDAHSRCREDIGQVSAADERRGQLE